MLRGIIGLDYMRKRGLLLEQVKVFVGFRVKRSFFENVICWKPDFQTFASVLILLCHHHMLMGLALSCILERGYRKWGEGRDVTIYPLITLHFYTFVSPIFWENQKSFFESKQIFIFIVLLSISMYVLLAPILPTYSNKADDQNDSIPYVNKSQYFKIQYNLDNLI